MTFHCYSPKPRRLVFILFILVSLCFAGTVFGKKKSASSSRGRHARAEKGRKSSARSRRSRHGGRENARGSRRGRHTRLSARDVRRQRALIAREQSTSLKALERRLHRPLTKRERSAELRRIESKYRRSMEEARRRAEAARLAAIARQRAIDQAMRDEVQALIAKDDTTGEDLEVRRIAVNALGNHAGTVVVMDPMTGRVYSVVNQEWGVRRGFKPCSTIKLVTGVAGLSENAIPLVDTVGDGYRMDLTAALAHSNNPFFEQVGSHIGFDKMVNYARELGLGEKTGVNVPFEFSGHLPEMKPGFIERRMFSYADGFEVTPLQLGTLVSAMANGGKLLVPQIPRTTKEQDKFNVKVRRELPIGPEVWQRMVPGMVGSVNYGSGRRAYDPLQTVAGKTGTCIGSGGWVGLFTSYAPLVSPRLAVVVIAQGTDGRRHFPAAVAGEIYRELNHRFGTAINMQVAATADDEENENSDADENGEAQSVDTTDAAKTTATSAPITTAPVKSDSATPRSTVKRVLMPIQKKSVDPQKPNNTQPAANTTLPPGNPSPVEQRPRRTQPEQP
jgi:membrane peptidoglycan carboxypeptidase